MSDFQHARLEWDEQGQPLSSVYDDVYFSRASGLEETRYVFLQHNRLAERFAALQPGQQLCIGETGFGTGLNFLCAWQLFEQVAGADSRLHFISVEKYPLTADDLARSLALWPELARQADALLGQYQAIHPGFQQLCFGNVTLTLLVGDVHDGLPRLAAEVDAWFLDGFAPAKNPEMWTPELFQQLARLSAPQATLATFTCAGFVRRGLNQAGFAMAKVKGFGHKREMLAGQLQPHAFQAPVSPPWFARPPQAHRQRTALVIGAGLAGCATAASLARRGWKVQVLDRHRQIAAEGSGNLQGVLYLKLSAHDTALSKLIVSGFGHTRRLLQGLPQGRDWQACGVLQLAFDDKEARRQAQLAAAFPESLLRSVNREQACELSGIALDQGGLFYPQAGWVHPPALCRHLLDHPSITFIAAAEVDDLRYHDAHWHAMQGNTCLARAEVVVLASAAAVRQFSIARELPLKAIRGQISHLPATAASHPLQTVVCGEGYIAPQREGWHTLGASFDFNNQDLALTPAEHIGNLAYLEQISGDLAQRLEARQHDPQTLPGRAAMRCTSPDYLPLIGPLAEREAFMQHYAVLSRDARQVPSQPCPWLPGLYVNTAHGSRGLVSAPLSGELIAAWLEQEPLPVEQAVAEACHPNRFYLRELIRGAKTPGTASSAAVPTGSAAGH